MGDDIGWMQPGIYHRGLMVGETPNIDRIGNEGAIFMDYVAMQQVSFPDINKSPTEQGICPPSKNTPIPGLAEVPGAIDPRTGVCLTPPRLCLWCKSSDGTMKNQTCKDEGPLTLERSKTVDEEIWAKVIDFLDRNDPKKTGKPEGIHLMIGRRPHAAFGNSTGDRQMLEYTKAGDGTRLLMIVLHDYAQREYAYGPAQGLPATKVGTFTQALYNEAKKQGWVVISTKNDSKRIFAFEPYL